MRLFGTYNPVTDYLVVSDADDPSPYSKTFPVRDAGGLSAARAELFREYGIAFGGTEQSRIHALGTLRLLDVHMAVAADRGAA